MQGDGAGPLAIVRQPRLRDWAGAAIGSDAFVRRAVPVGMLLFAAVWLANLGFTSLTPPADNLEQLTWVRALAWGYYKHPPLPTWLLWPAVQVFGWSEWPVSAMGAATTVAALAIFWRLLARLRGETHALLGLLAAACITYYNGRLHYYNHNVVLMLASTASAALAWQAFSTRRLRWWAALGCAIGMGALAKYQVVVTACSVLALWVHQRAWRDAVHRQGLLLAGLIALLLFAPHLRWLPTHGFGPVDYALGSSLGANFGFVERIADATQWLADQLLNRALPAWLFLITVGTGLRRGGPLPGATPTSTATEVHRRARALLLAWGLVPLAFMLLVSLSTGADLQPQWGTPFLLFAVPAVMELRPRTSWPLADPKRALMVFTTIQFALLAGNYLTSPRGPQVLRTHHWCSFDSRRAALSLEQAARRRLGGPVRVLIGPEAIAGAIALRLPEHPVVLIDGRRAISPWVGDDVWPACGAVRLSPTRGAAGETEFGSALPGWSWSVVPPADPNRSCATRTDP